MRNLLTLACAALSIGAAQAQPAPADTSLAALPRLDWRPRAAGVWSAVVGAREPGPLDFAAAPRADALTAQGEAPLPAALADGRGDVHAGYASVRLQAAADERFYGLGMRDSGPVELSGRTYTLRVHWTSHAPVPFLISSAGYGVVFNTARALHVQVGVGNRKDAPRLPPEIDRTRGRGWSANPPGDAVEASAVGTGLEVVAFAGRTPLEVVRRYNLWCGGGGLPARWGLGFWHRVPTDATAAQVEQEVDDFARHDLPLDVLGLEPGWQSASYPCTYEWDAQRFPDPAGFLRTLAARGISVNLWENVFVSRKAKIYPQLAPYTGSHMIWVGQVPDYTLDKARAVLTEQHQREHVALGVSGYKLDEVDQLEPDHARFPSGLCGEQYGQVLGVVMQKTIYDLFRQQNRRTCGLVRGSNAGASAYPFALYSDSYGHAQFVQALTSASLAGVLWCPEVRGAGNDEEWVRRFQTLALAPLAQLNGWASRVKPWSRPAATDLVREALKLRSRLVPYLYTAMADYQRDGTPPLRHMLLTDGLDAPELKRLEVSDQYLLGPSLLVAPLFAGMKTRKVVLPKGRWYDFYTGKLVGEGGTITVAAPLSQLPLFVRDGGIVPLMPPVNNLRGLKGPLALEVRHYGQRAGSYSLYDDDGGTFDYEQGRSSRQELRVSPAGGGLHGDVGPAHGGWTSRYAEFQWRFMTAEAAAR